MDDYTLEYFLSIKTVQLDLVKDRGYIIPKHEENSVDNIKNFREFMDKIEDDTLDDYWFRKANLLRNDTNLKQLKKLYQTNKDHKNHYPSWQIYLNFYKTKMLLVYYINLDGDIPVRVVRFLIEFSDFFRKIRENLELSIILISNTELTAESKKQLILVEKINFFLENELTYNPVKHVSNQQHILLTDEQALELEKEFKINRSKLPGIKFDNPIVKYYGFKKGDVIKVIRIEHHLSILAKKSLNYRVVII